MTRCKYSMPTVFSEKKTILFDSALDLMQFIQEIGEGNALASKRLGVYKDLL